MFILGHLGPTITGARALRRKVDLRWAAMLAIAPDLLDKPIALLFPAIVNENTRGFGHTLFASLLVLAALLAARRRLAHPLVLWCCYLGHFALDRMWLNNNPIVLFWPFLGSFPPPMHGEINGHILKWNVYGELAGLILLAAFARRNRFFERARFAAFLNSGVEA
jgi:membrane-bound metal-dependent hydrolase YbcI (DUF457 family)